MPATGSARDSATAIERNVLGDTRRPLRIEVTVAGLTPAALASWLLFQPLSAISRSSRSRLT